MKGVKPHNTDSYKDKTVLVTGATGYLASWVIHDLLNLGFNVRGTVRSLANQERYEALFKLPNAENNLTLVEANLLEDSGWDEATSNIDYVFHLATPLTSAHNLDENEMVVQAVNGTKFVTEAAIRNKCKKLIFTSSCLTITAGANNGSTLNEDNWPDPSCTSNYTKSKILAERTLWDLYKSQDLSSPHTEITSILPSLMFGPCPIDLGFLSFS